MKQLNIEKQSPAVINFNYDDLKASIEAELERYDIAVTEDTVADAKKMATELNKMKGDIDGRRKEAIKLVSAPIKDADEKMKGLVKLIESGRQRILEQVATFDQNKLDEIQKQLMQYMVDQREKHGIEPEFRREGYADLVILSSVTKTGSLTAKAVNTIRERVQSEKQLQDRTERRLLELENHCYRTGLEAPLQRQHVEHFLFQDDEEYGQHLERMMQAELDRQKAASERRQQQEQNAAPKAQPETAGHQEDERAQPKQPTRVLPAGKIACTVTATFEIEIHPDTPETKIKEHLEKNLRNAGITTLSKVEVQKHMG